MMHVSYEVFWTLNPRKLKPFQKAYEMELESRQNAKNLEAWLYGLYNQNAIASVLCKNSKYPSKPFQMMNGRKKTVQEEGMDFERYVRQFNAMRKNKTITN